MKKAFVALLFIIALPLSASAHTATTSVVSAAVAPVGTVGADASGLASFVLSAVALVVAGIALSRTRNHHAHHGA